MSRTVWTLVACIATFLLGIGAAQVMPEGSGYLDKDLSWNVKDGMLNLISENENGAFLIVGAEQQSEVAAQKRAQKRQARDRDRDGRSRATVELHARTVSLPVEELEHLTVYRVQGIGTYDKINTVMKVCACIFPPPPVPPVPSPGPRPFMNLLTTQGFALDDLAFSSE